MVIKAVTGVFLATVMLLFITGCKKGKITPDNPFTNTDTTGVDMNACIPILPPTGQSQGYNYVSDPDNYYMAPFFNPNNENEFLYLKRHAYQSLGLYTFNLLTCQKQLIYTGDIWYVPKWSENGWIIFSKSDGNVYKIKSNGEDLTQLTNEGCYHYPAWYFDQNKFVTYSLCLDADILFDADGIAIDTLPKLIGVNSSLERPPYHVNNAGEFINFFDTGNSYNFVYSIPVEGGVAAVGSVFWTSADEVVFSNVKGISRLTISSSNIANFKPSCNAKLYLYGSVNSSKTKMVWSRIDRKQLNPNTVYSKSRIYIMNVDGSDETEVNLE